MKAQRLCFASLFLVSLIVASAASAATCNTASLNGVWGYQVGASAGQFTSDGAGNIISGSQTVSINGGIVSQTYTGTYTVTAKCTGTITLSITGGGTGHASFVMDNGRKGAQIIDTDPGTIAGGFGLTQGVVTCGLTGTKTTFAAALLGKNTVLGPIAYVAQVNMDGAGHVTGSGTFDVNGAITSGNLSGTYTEVSTCTGTLQMTPTGMSALNFNFVVVNGGKEILMIETDANTEVAGNMQQ